MLTTEDKRTRNVGYALCAVLAAVAIFTDVFADVKSTSIGLTVLIQVIIIAAFFFAVINAVRMGRLAAAFGLAAIIIVLLRMSWLA